MAKKKIIPNFLLCAIHTHPKVKTLKKYPASFPQIKIPKITNVCWAYLNLTKMFDFCEA
ncbi:hypothetical protein Hanom_Chr02g00111081 [Helianthus anomalus]